LPGLVSITAIPRRCLVAALAGAGFEVLQVPPWRTHRERHRRGPGKTEPGDALSIAKVVLIDRDELSPAEEPELVRALGMLELQRRRFVGDRTQAIQRLRSDRTHRRALPHRDRSTAPPPPSKDVPGPARSPKERPLAKPAAPSNATSPTSSIASSSPGQTALPLTT